MTTLREEFEAHLRAMPDWAPEFEVHRPWVEALIWEAMKAVAERCAKPVPMTTTLFSMPGTLLFKSTEGKWFYQNHASTWQSCPAPCAQAEQAADACAAAIRPRLEVIMSDRELLEAAAKAAGYDLVFNADYYPKWKPSAKTGRIFWNPLTDDSDAFRLAVKLGIFASPEFIHFLGLERFAQQHQDDVVAYRRAIVRAAAQIGSGQK